LIDNDRKFGKKTYEKTKSFARKTGFVIIVDTDNQTGTLSYNLIMNNVPALTLELGEPYLINEKNVEFGLMAIWNILADLKMINLDKDPFEYPVPPAYGAGKLLTYLDKPYSSKSGIIRFIANPGESIRKDQPFARLVNAFGKHQETVRAVNDGIVLGHSDSSVVFPGMPIMAFGISQDRQN
jgi:predicted deacylase